MRLDDRTVKVLWVAFIILAAVIMLQNLIILFAVPPPTATPAGTATARVNLCVDNPPHWLNPVSCADAHALQAYSCDVSAIDNDTGQVIVGYNATLINGPSAGAPLFENISRNGTLSFNATTGQVGNYTVSLEATDNATCPLSGNTTFNLTILPGTGPPILIKPIPNSTWQKNTILIPYNLNDYFVDPEGGTLLFRAAGNTNIKISIAADGTVTLQPANGYCGQEIVLYTATNSVGSTNSNFVTLNVTCPQQSSSSGGSTSSGGGGGGGGYALPQATCSQSYYCYPWDTCQYTKAVSATGDNYTVNITGVQGSQIYTVEGPLPVNTSLYYTGYQSRKCIDTNECKPGYNVYVRNCSYKPSCHDHIQNQDETGVDCGGVCGPCNTCTDGIQDGQETGVDCGGPSCKPCYSCTDGKMDGKELGVDCGGPDCPACATCFDGIQNQGETGVDCGGPCTPCAQMQTPKGQNGLTPLQVALLSAIALLLLIIGATVLLRRALQAWLSALALRYKKRNRVTLIDADTRESLLSELAALERTIDGREPLPRQAAIGGLLRKYLHAALGVETEADSQVVDAALTTQHVREDLRSILASLYRRVFQTEFTDAALPLTFLHALLHEMRFIVYETGVTTLSDAKRMRDQAASLPAAPERVSSEDDIYSALGLGVERLRFRQFLLSERLYAQIEAAYGAAGEASKRRVYPDAVRFNREMAFASRQSKRLIERLQ